MLAEVFKSFYGFGPPILQDIFKVESHSHQLRSGLTFQLPKTVSHINSFEFRAILAWNHLPASIKSSDSVSKFKYCLRSVNVYCSCYYFCVIFK